MANFDINNFYRMSKNNSFKEVRYRIINAMLLVGMLVSVPSAVVSAIRGISNGMYFFVYIEVFVAIVAMFAYFSKKILSPNARTAILFSYIFLIAIFSLYTYGLIGLGIFMLLFITLLLTSLFGVSLGIISLLVSTALFALLGYGVIGNYIKFSIDFNEFAYSPREFLWRGIYFITFGSMGIAAVGSVNHFLRKTNKSLIKSEERLSLAINSVNEVIWDIDLVHGNSFISPHYEEVLPFAPEKLAQDVSAWKEIIYEEDIKRVSKAIQDQLQGRSESLNIEYRIKDNNGALHWLQSRGKVVKRDKNGKPLRVVGTHANIGPRKEMEQILRESEQKYRSVFLNAYDAILLISNRSIIDVNNSAEAFLDVTKDDLIGMDIAEFCPFEQSDGSNSVEKLTLLLNEAISNGNATSECEFISKSGKQFYASVSFSSLDGSEHKIVQLIIHDITEYRQFEQEKLKAIVETEEKERLKLAGNLHDDVGPLLSSLNMYLSLVKREETQNKSEVIDNMEEILKDAISSVREISNSISPHALTNYGLVYAVNSFIDRSKGLVKFHFDENIGEERLPSFIEMICYRIVKEMINNTLKYANTETVQIQMRKHTSYFTLSYSDNGVGFDLDSLLSEGSSGLGLMSITSRLKTLGAKYEMHSKPGNGFSFEMRIRV